MFKQRLLFVVVLVACGAPPEVVHPDAGRPPLTVGATCSTPAGSGQCSSSITALICECPTPDCSSSPVAKEFRCRGPGGCAPGIFGDGFVCDMSDDQTGDPCTPKQEGGAICTPDSKSEIVCRDGGWVRSQCPSQCYEDGGFVFCR